MPFPKGLEAIEKTHREGPGLLSLTEIMKPCGTMTP